jgi:hypothetical protein
MAKWQEASNDIDRDKPNTPGPSQNTDYLPIRT